MLRYLPLLLAFTAIAGVAVFDGLTNYRWTSNTEAEDFAKLLNDKKEIPVDIGPWKGTDYEVDDNILRAAGAEGYVSRRYKNEETGQVVEVWLIVGTFKHVIRHTPDVCYPAQDYRRGENIQPYSFKVEGQPEDQFLTSYFAKGGHAERVFWSWHRPSKDGKVVWNADTNRTINRERYAGASALFKLYFTTVVTSDDEAPQASAANDFSKVFLPIVNNLILSGKKDAA